MGALLTLHFLGSGPLRYAQWEATSLSDKRPSHQVDLHFARSAHRADPSLRTDDLHYLHSKLGCAFRIALPLVLRLLRIGTSGRLRPGKAGPVATTGTGRLAVFHQFTTTTKMENVGA